MVDGTVTIGVLGAALGFTRKAQSKKLLVALGDLGGTPSGQRLDPEIPIRVDSDSPATVNFNTLDFDTDPKNFISHALWIYQSLAEAYGASTAYMEIGRAHV